MGKTLSDAAITDISRMKADIRRLLAAAGLPEKTLQTGPPHYLVLTPVGGIPAADTGVPGDASCQIARRWGTDKDIQDTNSKVTVYNASDVAIDAGVHVLAHRDAWGDYYAASSEAGVCEESDVATFYESRLDEYGDCFIYRQRLVSISLIDGCLSVSRTDWQDGPILAECATTEPPPEPEECTESLEPDIVDDFERASTGDNVPLIEASVDDAGPWSLGETKRFTITLTNQGTGDIYIVPRNAVGTPNPLGRNYCPGFGIGGWSGIDFDITAASHTVGPSAIPFELRSSVMFPPSYAYDGATVTLEPTESFSFWVDVEMMSTADEYYSGGVSQWFYMGVSWQLSPLGSMSPAPAWKWACEIKTGRCCVGTSCSVTTEAVCTGLGGTWTEGGDCTLPCPV